MFFVLPSAIIFVVYLLAAVLPGIFLLRYIYRHDTIEREPAPLLASLLLMGVLAALASILLETVGIYLLSGFVSEDSAAYKIILAFLVVAVVEEGTKLFFLKRRSWRSPSFNYQFDGIVYSVFVSLGFAIFENIKYVFNYGLSVALPRALLAVPGHMGFAVFMGIFYGRAKLCDNRGDSAGRNANLLGGFAVSVLLHGFYDACAMMGTVLSTVLFGIFVVVMYITVIMLVKKQSASDRPISY